MARWANGSAYTYNNNIIYKDNIIERRDVFETINYYNAYWGLEFLKAQIDKMLDRGRASENKTHRATYKLIVFLIYLYTEKDDKKLSEITEEDMDEFVYYLSRQKIKLIPIYISYAKNLFDNMIKEGELNNNPAFKIWKTLNKNRKTKKYYTNIISDEQIEKGKTELPEHLKLYMSFVLSTGIKLHQIKRLKWENVDLKERIAVMVSCGNKKETMYFNQTVADMLLNEKNRRIEERLNDFGYVFRSDYKQYFEKDSPLSTSTISRWCKDIGAIIGIDDLRHLDFRHMAIRKLLSASGSVGMTNIILNHPHLSNTNARFFIDENVNNELLQEYKDICEM